MKQGTIVSSGLKNPKSAEMRLPRNLEPAEKQQILNQVNQVLGDEG